MSKYIWYVCYGSNILYERFMCYLTGSSLESYHYSATCVPFYDQTPPKRTRVVEIPYNIYFSSHSDNWNSSVCFLNDTKKGRSVGRAYLITEEQFEHVKRNEGSKYSKLVKLEDIDGIEAFTFTNDKVLENTTVPGRMYMKVIRDGLVECGFEKSDATRYLKKYIWLQGLKFPVDRDGGKKGWNEITFAQKRHRLFRVLDSSTVGFWFFVVKINKNTINICN